ncbi:MAG: thioredoxin domain-containing protein [Myxococcales bacterium]|nr:thioredoxin domain-containing protein [Myxococcales bacterium]
MKNVVGRGRRPLLPHAMSLAAFLVFAGCGGATPAPATTGAAPKTAPIAPAGSAAVAGEPGAAGEEDADVPISRGNPAWGSRTALVTIVEFGDLQCPFCARVEPTLARIRETYGPDTVRIVWKNNPLPFHASARPAAEAAMGVFALAGRPAFWKFYASVLGGREELGPQAFERWASEAGVTDAAAFRDGLARHAWAAAIERDEKDGKALGVFGTPTFFVNGLPLAGALPFPTFQGVIDDQITKAKDKLATGTAPDRLYAELSKENRAHAAAQDDEGHDEDDDSAVVYQVPLGKSPARGPASALVTIVEFADYQCPFCIRVEPTLKALRDKYGDKLRIVFKDAPLSFHPRAEPAAQAALEVRAEKGDAAFWAMHDALLSGGADLSDAGLVELASRQGARAAAVKAAIAGHTHRDSIDADGDVAEDFAANGTPHFFVNGRRLVGAQPAEKFEALIDEEAARAEALLRSGTKPDALYATLVQGGKGAGAPETRALPAGVSVRGPSRGAATARVVVHEWSDFQCPFCKRAEPTLEQMLHDYGTRVRLVWHDLPLPMHPDARLAARAAREALAQKGERGFWSMHDLLFAHQDQLKRADLDGYAHGLGLDMTRWAQALDGDAHEHDLDPDKDTAEAMSIAGTPAFVIVPAGSQSGYFIGGAQGYPRLRRVIERALAEAK